MGADATSSTEGAPVAVDFFEDNSRDTCSSRQDHADMPVVVRPMQADEARRFLEVHHDSVRGLAAGDNPPNVIEAWAPLPITGELLQRFLETVTVRFG